MRAPQGQPISDLQGAETGTVNWGASWNDLPYWYRSRYGGSAGTTGPVVRQPSGDSWVLWLAETAYRSFFPPVLDDALWELVQDTWLAVPPPD